MNVTDRLVLAEDVVIVAIDSLPPEQRQRLEDQSEGFAITRLHGRSRSKVIDAEMAKLLDEFKTGKTIVEAIINFCRCEKHDPERTLEDAYPVLQRLIQENFLVSPDSDQSEAVRATMAAGDTWGTDLKIVRPVQILDDSEIYLATQPNDQQVALKIARVTSNEWLNSIFQKEARILQAINGRVSPQLFQHGIVDDRCYLAIEWCAGLDAGRASAKLRANRSKKGRGELLELLCAITNAYAELHQLQIVHGDVHPGNLIVGLDGKVKIIDFGLGRLIASDDPTLVRSRRGGFGYFYEPEYAQAFLANLLLPQATFSGEQHILAHLLYNLCTGHGFTRFSAEHKQSMTQLSASLPMAFEEWGLKPWPDVERILARALSQDAAGRFQTTAEMAESLRQAEVPEMSATKTVVPIAQSVHSQGYCEGFLESLNPFGALFQTGIPEPPYSSVNFGSAGVAYFLHRMAALRNNPEYLSWSKLWIERAVAETKSMGELAFTNDEKKIPRSTIGPISLYHTQTGVFVVKALIGHAMGDFQAQFDGINGFLSAGREACDNLDLTLGVSGLLLGSAFLYELFPDHEPLCAFGQQLFDLIHSQLAAKPPIAEKQSLQQLGIAHGWSGMMYSLLMWLKVTSGQPTPVLSARFQQLAEQGEPVQFGIRWPRAIMRTKHPDSRYYDRSWCNGTAGMIFFWTLVHSFDHDPRWLTLAEGAVINVVNAQESISQLCCGRTGQAYGVLNYFKHTGDERWLDCALRLADESVHLSQAAVGAEFEKLKFSLYKGSIGNALLAAELDDPLNAAMPMFELERWR
ncbi:MAG: lanthionine synthetase LanC family protein [Pirellulaceae bacterium]